MRTRPHESWERDTGARPPKQGRPPVPAATPDAVSLLALQRTAGNAAVARILDQERHAHGPGCGHATTESAAPPVQRAPTFTRTGAPAESDRDAALRMLDRVARTAERVILAGNPKARNKFTPHLAVNLLPDGSLGISGNTGKRVVTEQQRQTIEQEIRGFADGSAPRAGHNAWGSSADQRQRERQDRSKLRALDAGSYAEHHPESPELADIYEALHKPIRWFSIGTPVKKGVPAQHGEMTLLGEQVAAWKRAPRDPDDPKTVHMGGVKLACVACQWAFDAVNETIGRDLGYRVVAAGAHGQFFPNWLMPQWMRGEQAVVDVIRSRAAAIDAELTNDWVVNGELATGDFVHDPPDSGSEYESD
ncbi:hypothetical protein SAMN04487983_1017100 [Streptomyces sp. yr375]|uniref:hypothetical protein n=1 Tax=Streptomyces sp. yr375 TaxID=1761906 RepID=UPI0008AB088E|nr:hypothetical protein [Streptomyces sp. yr375]SER50776.1 hypothetical protein SAMN04487983_1017100 [Streptomyces sp. yr375]